MPAVIKGQDILNALNELDMPSNLTEIVDYLSANYEGSKTELLDKVKDILEAGVQYGYIQETENRYHINNESGKDEQSQPQQTEDHKEADKNETSKQDGVKSLMSVNQLTGSSESLISTKNKRIVAKYNRQMKFRLHPLNSSDDDEDELHDSGDCCGSRFRNSRRSRSRSGRRGKSHSVRRTRRRRRG